MSRNHLNWMAPLGLMLVLAVVWEAAVRALAIPAYLLPAPSAIASAAVEDAGSILRNAGITMAEAACGFTIANLVSFCLAVVLVHSPLLEKAVMPWAIALKTTPVIAVAPLLTLWLKTGFASKVVASGLICFFPVLVNATLGLRSVDPDALDLFASLSASRWQVFWHLRLPGSLPYVFSALKISSSLSVVGAIVGEFVGSNRGLGYQILSSYNQMETPMMFACIAASALGGILFFGVIGAIEGQVLRWQHAGQELASFHHLH